VQLFERLPRDLRLTREGQAYRADALGIRASPDTARDRMRGIASGETGLLRIGYVEATARRGVVPEALRAFRSLAPSVRLELTPMGMPEQLELIEREALDGGFVYLFDNLPDGFLSVELPPQNVVLALPSRSEINRMKKLFLRDLADVLFVTFRRAAYPAYHARLFAACAQIGVVPRLVQEGANEAQIQLCLPGGIELALCIEKFEVPLGPARKRRPDNAVRCSAPVAVRDCASSCTAKVSRSARPSATSRKTVSMACSYATTALDSRTSARRSSKRSRPTENNGAESCGAKRHARCAHRADCPWPGCCSREMPPARATERRPLLQRRCPRSPR